MAQNIAEKSRPRHPRHNSSCSPVRRTIADQPSHSNGIKWAACPADVQNTPYQDLDRFAEVSGCGELAFRWRAPASFPTDDPHSHYDLCRITFETLA